nr:ribonuclease H-like domain, reverse transcriptase, RNA-dependent DNA polymerase [Tanacetum cinerariifolium]
MFTQHENKGKYFRGRRRGKHRFSQGINHENFKEEKKDGETSHRNYNRNNFKKSSYDTSKLQCYKCKKIGHIAPNFPQRTKPNEQSNLIEEDLEPTLLMTILEDSNEEKHVKEVEEQKHARLGHLNFESLRSMAQRDLVHGIPAIKHTTQVCDVYLIGKHSRAPFPKKAKARSTSPLDSVYGDLCGPIIPPTPSGKKYIFLLVDDYSRYMWVYFLSTKDQAFDTFKEYKKSIENELRTTLKMLRTDQGGELTINEFTQYSYAKVPSQHLTKLDDRSSRMVYLGNEQGSKAYRLFDPTTQRIYVSRDVKFKENETWDWKEYTSEEPKWTDFKIGNLEVTNENHDQGIQPVKEDNEFPNNDDDDYASPTRDSPTHSQAPHTQSTRSLQRQDNGKVYRLIKVLYGLRQAQRAWNIKLDNTLKSLDFKKCALEQAIYTKTSKDSTLLIGVYVDELIITGTPKKKIDKFKAQMEEKFKMSDLGLLAYYLGIEVTQTDGDISIKQSAYANKILKEAGMLDCNETLIPMDPRTRLKKLEYTKQAIVKISSCEYEFIAATAAAIQALWLKRLLSKLTHSEEKKATIRVDNKFAIALIKNPVFHGRSKHIDMKYHFIRECVEREDIQVEFNEETCIQFKCNEAIKFTVKEFTMVTDNDLDEQKGSGKVCINSKVLDYIHDRVSVTVNGRVYSVLIKEIANWSPSILQLAESSPFASECESFNGTESDENKDVLVNEEDKVSNADINVEI